MKITVVGSINMDYTLKVDELPNKGETLIAKEFYKAGGGKGANQAIAAKRLGAEVAMIGCLGNDSMGQELVKKLEEEKIDISGMKYVDIPSGNAVITVNENGNNTIIVYPGANNELDFEWIKRFEHLIEESEYVILQFEIPMETVEETAKLAKAKGKTVILNPAPAKKMPENIYKYIDILTPNETELEKITGCSNIKDGVKVLHKKGINTVIVTLGDKGSYYSDADDEFEIETFKVNAIDTTAAGDSYNGAIAVGFIEGMKIKETLRFASAVGALSTTKIGAQESLPYREEVDKILKNS